MIAREFVNKNYKQIAEKECRNGIVVTAKKKSLNFLSRTQ